MKMLIQDLHFSYGSHDVLQGVSMEISPGQMVCIAGPNGSGKSTLLKCLARVLIPKSGAVFLDGREMTRLGPRELARMAGYVPQNGVEIFPFTVLETVLMGRKPHLTWGVTRHDLEVVARVLKFMGMGELAQRSLAELSGGQKQKVFIARALAQEPQVFLLDEPTSSLDIRHQLEVLEVVKALAHRQKHIVIMVLHDLNLAARFSDYMVMLKDGQIYAAGKPRAVVTRDNIGAVYGVEALIMESSFGPYVIPVGPVQGSDISLQAAAF